MFKSRIYAQYVNSIKCMLELPQAIFMHHTLHVHLKRNQRKCHTVNYLNQLNSNMDFEEIAQAAFSGSAKWHQIISRLVSYSPKHYTLTCICSAQFAQFKIALRKLEIAKLLTNFEKGIQFRNCPVQFQNFGIDGGEVVCTDDE